MSRIQIEQVGRTWADLGESPFWDSRSGVLSWVDIPAGKIHRLTAQTGVEDSFCFGEPVGFVAPTSADQLFVAARDGWYLLDWPSKTRALISDIEADRLENRFNDGTTDQQGRIWCGSMQGGSKLPGGTFYRVEPDGSPMPWRDQIHTTNGLAFAPDGKTMYFSDSHPSVRSIWRCDYDPQTGTPATPELFLDTSALPGRPDGGTVDADGHYWMTGIGGWQLYRISPAGDIVQTVDLPVEKPTKAVFGGPDLATLFVTTNGGDISSGTDQPLAGHLLAITGLGVRGVAQSPARLDQVSPDWT